MVDLVIEEISKGMELFIKDNHKTPNKVRLHPLTIRKLSQDCNYFATAYGSRPYTIFGLDVIEDRSIEENKALVYFEEENKQRLIVVIMGQNCEKFLPMCLESVKEAEAIVYCDGGSTDGTLQYIDERFMDLEVGTRINNTYNQQDPKMNGKQRNFYLNYLKENYPNDWALILDADEVVEDLGKLVSFIQEAIPGLYSPKMRHFEGDLGHEDATVLEHFCLNRLFKISEAGYYPEVEHPVLQPKENSEQSNGMGYYLRATTIWHLAYVPNLWSFKQRYENHLRKSNMHTPEFLKNWYYNHLFGQYPKSQVNLTDIPEVILKEFGIDKDEFYFANRGIEVKHPIMVKQWNDYFKPKSVLDLGCGRGAYLFFWKWFVNKVHGMEISMWAIKNSFLPYPDILCQDISDGRSYDYWDLIVAFDVLEHLNEEKLQKTLKNMVKNGNKFLISVPVIGDPNLNADKTHIQRKTKNEWIKLFESYGIKIKETPKDWLYSEQIIIGEK